MSQWFGILIFDGSFNLEREVISKLGPTTPTYSPTNSIKARAHNFNIFVGSKGFVGCAFTAALVICLDGGRRDGLAVYFEFLRVGCIFTALPRSVFLADGETCTHNLSQTPLIEFYHKTR